MKDIIVTLLILALVILLGLLLVPSYDQQKERALAQVTSDTSRNTMDSTNRMDTSAMQDTFFLPESMPMPDTGGVLDTIGFPDTTRPDSGRTIDSTYRGMPPQTPDSSWPGGR